MSLFKKYGESLLGQPIGIEESRVRQAKDLQSKGSLQHGKSIQRAARRGYREAMRSGDYGKAADMLDWAKSKGQTFAGIGMAGSDLNVARKGPGNNRMKGVAQNQNEGIQPANLSQRIGLFDEMKVAASKGQDLSGFKDRAFGLGVDENGFGIGASKAAASSGFVGPPNPSSFQGKPNLDSPSFESRIAAFASPEQDLVTTYMGGPNMFSTDNGIGGIPTQSALVDSQLNQYQSSLVDQQKNPSPEAEAKSSNLFNQLSILDKKKAPWAKAGKRIVTNK